MLTSDAHTSSPLYEAALRYADSGYSVIPIYGDLAPTRAKVAATDWGHYQRQYPTQADLARWFHLYPMGGIALVTGRISRLLILDFDHIEIHHQFVAAFPHLCKTMVVTSAQRRLPHYYYRLPTGIEVASRKIAGLDLLAEGRYVVAAPTQIAGRLYTITYDHAPLIVTHDDLTALVAFIERCIRHQEKPQDSVSRGTLSPTDPSHSVSRGTLSTSDAPDDVSRDTVSARLVSAAHEAFNTLRLAAKEIVSDSSRPDSGAVDTSLQINKPPYAGHAPNIVVVPPGAADNVSRGTLSAARLIQQYQHIAGQVGRNEALFRMAVRARDYGWSQIQVESVLTPVHVAHPAPADHASETSQQRIHEAQRTIASAFKRPPRSVPQTDTQVGLPVSVREALLKLKLMPVLRVLDGLILKGIVAGARLTEKIITALLENIIGRHSVLKALKACLPDGTPVFAPSPRTPTHTDVAAEVTLFPGQKMLFVGATESNKNRRGRPEQAYEMPTVYRLCQALGVSYSPSDPITAADLTSTRRTRQAIHRELLRRRPGLYSRKLLARRLGVSVRSVQRYHRNACVRVRFAFRQREIFWETLSNVPKKDDVPPHSAFLQDETGKRYPMDISIVKWLLTRRKRVFLMYQLPNHYSVLPDEDISQPVSPETALTAREQAVKRLIAHAEASEKDMQIAACSHNDLSLASDGDRVAAAAHRGIKTGQNNPNPYKTVSPYRPEDAIPQGLPVDPTWRYTPSVSTRVMGAPSISPVPADALLFTPQTARVMPATPKPIDAYRNPLASWDIERSAQRLYDVIRRRCTEKTGYMTLARARQLLDQFGSGAVKRATHLLEMRHSVQNPAGFLISVLRSQAKLAGVLG